MPRVVKVALWTIVFGGCALGGAIVAAHSNPFPPGVDRPGDVVSASPTATPSPQPDRWHGAAHSYSFHSLYVGGRCTTRWRGSLGFVVEPNGRVNGTGVLRLTGGLRCDFQNAQVNARRVLIAVRGVESGGELRLHLGVSSIDPIGASDFGGLLGTLEHVRPRLTVRSGGAEGKISLRRPDEEGRGYYYSATGFKLSCVTC